MNNNADVWDNTAPPVDLGNGWRIFTAIRPDGTDAYWLVANDAEGQTTVTTPDHEQTGPLPARIREGIRLHRCGAPRADGHPCRAYVSHHGDRCHWHAREAAIR